MTPEEHVLADQLTESLCRLNRARRVETIISTLVMQDIFEVLNDGTEPVDRHPDHLLAAGFFNNSYDGVLSRTQRYVAASEAAITGPSKHSNKPRKIAPSSRPSQSPLQSKQLPSTVLYPKLTSNRSSSPPPP